MNFYDLEISVLEWAKDRNILNDSSAEQQVPKLIEEVDELVGALKDNHYEEIIDAIGDIMVVLTLIAHFNNVNLIYCYMCAYREIKDRKGKMINGVFVKEEE